MALEDAIVYVVVLGLPLWLVAEALLNRPVQRLKAEAALDTPKAEGAGLERLAREGAPASAPPSSAVYGRGAPRRRAARTS